MNPYAPFAFTVLFSILNPLLYSKTNMFFCINEIYVCYKSVIFP